MKDDSSMTWQQAHDLVEDVMRKLGMDAASCPAEGWQLCHRIAQTAYKRGLADNVQRI